MRSGFSLVELSIVLVILGLLVGGVLAGQSLIRAAELRGVAAETGNFKAAVHTFEDKYFAFPGDMPNAASFWGAEPAANCPGSESTPSNTKATCNGDGNGLLDVFSAATLGNEAMRFWQHLANASLIAGQYTGVRAAASGTYTAIIGTNIPRSKLPAAGWGTLAQDNTGDLFSEMYTYNYIAKNSLRLGAQESTLANPWRNVLAPEDAWNIDNKIDDGKPGQGVVLAVPVTLCTTDADNANLNAQYKLSEKARLCGMIYNLK